MEVFETAARRGPAANETTAGFGIPFIFDAANDRLYVGVESEQHVELVKEFDLPFDASGHGSMDMDDQFVSGRFENTEGGLEISIKRKAELLTDEAKRAIFEIANRPSWNDQMHQNPY